MNKSDLISKLAEAAGHSKKDTEAVVDALAGVVAQALAAGDDVTLPGIGKLAVKAKAARTGRNPKTGETMQIAARKVPAFTALKALKDAVAE
ncbi:HU family DNA-binding protein [Niveibacterium sp. SC-1]|uniref:HU family DNA-binding protein n=1 Tax=Niveibacterium sp. SC-1 TaxID=3135646 RepID=UPI00312004D1